MRVRKLDENGDIVTSGEVWAFDRVAVAQTVSTRLRLFLGEYFRNITEGVAWFEQSNGTDGILGKGMTLVQIESILRNRIARTEGVLKLLSFNLTFDIATRQMSIATSILTIYGVEEIKWVS